MESQNNGNELERICESSRNGLIRVTLNSQSAPRIQSQDNGDGVGGGAEVEGWQKI